MKKTTLMNTAKYIEVFYYFFQDAYKSKCLQGKCNCKQTNTLYNISLSHQSKVNQSGKKMLKMNQDWNMMYHQVKRRFQSINIE